MKLIDRVVEWVPMHREKVCIWVTVSSRYVGTNLLLSAMKQEKFFTYILQSLKNFSFYVGQCDDLDWRISKHNDGQSTYTSSKIPWRLVYFEMYKSRSEALLRERKIKKMKSRKYIIELINNKQFFLWKRWPSCWKSPDASGESVYMGNCIIPICRDEPLTLRNETREILYLHPSEFEGFFFLRRSMWRFALEDKQT